MEFSKSWTATIRKQDDWFGSANGYEYRYRVWSDEDIIHRYSCLGIRDDVKFLCEIRTTFRVGGDSGSDGENEIIDFERFEIGAQSCDSIGTSLVWSQRLEDYWLTDGEREALADHASAFAARQQEQEPQRRVIPIAVDLDIRTVRRLREWGESMGEARERAMRCDKLFPLWLAAYERYALVNVEKPPYGDLVQLVRYEMQRLKVVQPQCFVDCKVCRRSPRIGDEYAILEGQCGHEFHYPCLVRCLFIQLSCPICSHPILPSRPLSHSILSRYMTP